MQKTSLSFEGLTLLGVVLAIISFLLLFGGIDVVSAHTVTDGNTGSPIEGALVTVEGTELNSLTASDGTYTITDVPVGTYTVTCTKKGYRSQSYTNVEVKKDQTTIVDFVLLPDTLPYGHLFGWWCFYNNQSPLGDIYVSQEKEKG